MTNERSAPSSTTISLLDRYLLDGDVSKEKVILALLAEPTFESVAPPFHRALKAVGARAADEALMAVRLIFSGHKADDASIGRMRDLCARIRQGPDAEAARASYAELVASS
ncbi:MAG TPA: hypothetical protein VGZ00_07640 [Candidatus Baltobacteraceae bacterium]|nr:hypothetical protein [Candidatus Baltobacteraceae bacterium]